MTVMAVVFAVGCVVLLYLYFSSQREIRAQRSNLEKHQRALDEMKRAFDAVSAHNDTLAPYQKIMDVEQAIRERREEYLRSEKEARERAQAHINDARDAMVAERATHKEEIKEARRLMKERQEAAENQLNLLMESAQREADRIVLSANQKAEEIAGDALTALREAKELERVARAMKNLISGYGDEYLVPSASVLDDLADHFSHKDAGTQLKTARARTRELVKLRRAATCSYAEPKRKETAIHFVLDAFNGKVDSILSMVRKDNYGTLQQEISDAFSIVNFNGQAFRDAQITPEYLDARLQELRWAVVVVELKEAEREEQRAIQQAIREEEKARRDYEKAIKEAEREERQLQKAMEDARRELAAAGEEERAQFLAKLQFLEEKLHEAEAKNQRAISMAQQTKRGHVYVISNVGSFGEDVYKIGMTRRLEPVDRIKELGDASVPFEFDVHAMIYSEDAPKLESSLHREFVHLRVNKVNLRKEFFRVQLSEVRQLLESQDLSVHWTMLAEAQEYRESLAIASEGHTPLPVLPLQCALEHSEALDVATGNGKIVGVTFEEG